MFCYFLHPSIIIILVVVHIIEPRVTLFIFNRKKDHILFLMKDSMQYSCKSHKQSDKTMGIYILCVCWKQINVKIFSSADQFQYYEGHMYIGLLNQ